MLPVTVSKLASTSPAPMAPQRELDGASYDASSFILKYLSTPQLPRGDVSLRVGHFGTNDCGLIDAEALTPPSFRVIVNAPTSALFESALERLQAIQVAKSSSSLEKSDAAVSATLSAVYELDKRGENRSAAREMMVFVESSLEQNSIAQANQLLASVNVAELSSRSLIGMVRSTFRVRKFLPAWEKVYRDSWKQVRELGKSPEALFVGLPRVAENEVASTTN